MLSHLTLIGVSQLRPEGEVSEELLLKILDDARWAPSAYNLQPWRVRFLKERGLVEVRVSSTHKVGPLDHDHEVTLVDLGCFIESFRLAASKQQVKCSIELSNSHKGPIYALIRLALDEAVVSDPLAKFLQTRMCNRKLYSTVPVSYDARDALSGLPCESGVETLFLEKGNATYLAEAIEKADWVRMLHRGCHDEFHRSVRWSQESVKANSIGQHVDTFEVALHEKLVLRLTKTFRALTIVDAVVGVAKLASSYARKQVLASGLLGALSVSMRRPETLIRAGMQLQRFWLKASSLNLAFQPLAVVTALMHFSRSEAHDLNREQLQSIRDAESIVSKFCKSTDNIVLFFRLGEADVPKLKTERLNAQALLDP